MSKILNIYKADENLKVRNFVNDNVETVKTLKDKWSKLSESDRQGWYIRPDVNSEEYVLIYPFNSDTDCDYEVNLFTLGDTVALHNKYTGDTVTAGTLKYSWSIEKGFIGNYWVLLNDTNVCISGASREYVNYYMLDGDDFVNHKTLVRPIKASVLTSLWSSLKPEDRLGWTVLQTGTKIYDSISLPRYLPLSVGSEFINELEYLEDKTISVSEKLFVNLKILDSSKETGIGSFDFTLKTDDGKDEIYTIHYKDLHYTEGVEDGYSFYFNIDFISSDSGVVKYDFIKEIEKTILINKDDYDLFDARINFMFRL